MVLNCDLTRVSDQTVSKLANQKFLLFAFVNASGVAYTALLFSSARPATIYNLMYVNITFSGEGLSGLITTTSNFENFNQLQLTIHQ